MWSEINIIYHKKKLSLNIITKIPSILLTNWILINFPGRLKEWLQLMPRRSGMSVSWHLSVSSLAPCRIDGIFKRARDVERWLILVSSGGIVYQSSQCVGSHSGGSDGSKCHGSISKHSWKCDE